MDHKLFKRLVHWTAGLFIVHFVSMFTYAMTVSNVFAHLYLDQMKVPALMLLACYSLFLQSCFTAILAYSETTYVEYRYAMRDALKAGEFSIAGELKRWLLKESLFKAGIYVLFQIPYAIVNAAGVGFLSPSLAKFMDFYAMDSFFYFLTHVPFLAMLLKGLTFGIINIIFTVVVILFAKRNVEDSML